MHEQALYMSLNVLSVWPFFVILAALFALAGTRLFQLADGQTLSDSTRVYTLDGLRAVLAFGVALSHAVRFRGTYLNLATNPSSSGSFYEYLGNLSVEMFFMITGYLFWSQVIRNQGDLSWLKLYIGRVCRIGPVYLLAVTAVLVIVLARTGLQLNEPATQLLREAGRWLALGIRGLGPINGYENPTDIMRGVTWTLAYEWKFYLLLPVLAWLVRVTHLHLAFSVAGLTLSLLYEVSDGSNHGASYSIIAALFFSGMVCASVQRTQLPPYLRGSIGSAIAVLCVALAMSCFDDDYSAGAILLIGLAVYLVSVGCTVWGVLTSRYARRLGNISYGVYLLHGIIYTIIYSIAPVRAFAATSPLCFWIMTMVSVGLVTVVALAAHVLVERPGINLGHRLAMRLVPASNAQASKG